MLRDAWFGMAVFGLNAFGRWLPELLRRRFSGPVILRRTIVPLVATFLGLQTLSASAADAPPMLVPGQMDVSAGGAFTYTVPITVAPGTAGMAPSLSLEYSSQSGDGIVGLGWSLTGLPTISRCPRTLAQDNVHGSVNYDANDRFCMDGQRLIAITGTYGANLTEYRTEVEGFTKIVSNGTAGTGPSWFKVWTKSGQIMEFGNTTDSRVLAQGLTTVRVWSVNKISDTKGNYLTVTYTIDAANSQNYPTRIDYTGNASATPALTPYNSVQFSYNTARPDQVPLYHAGALQKTTVLLTNVKTFTGTTLVRDYQLTYELGTTLRRSRITQIKLCDGATPTPNCLAPTTFGWQGTRDTIALTASANSLAQGKKLLAAEFNGDGLTDIVTEVASCASPNTGAVFAGNSSNTFINANAQVGNSFLGYSPLCFPLVKGFGTAPARVADFTGDGRSDIQFFASSVFQLPSGNGSNFLFDTGDFTYDQPSYLPPWPDIAETTLGDFNGDGRTDFFWRQAGTTTGTPYYSNGSAGDSSFTAGSALTGYSGTAYVAADFDGNGCTDILQQGAVANIKYWCNPSVASLTTTNWATNTSNQLAFGDFNGDGITDILVANKTAAGSVQLSTGKTLVASGFSVPAGWGKYLIYAADFNGDGRCDVALIAPGMSGMFGVGTAHAIWLSTGTGFVQAVTIANTNAADATTSTTDPAVKAVVGDLNNDGSMDLWIQKPSGDTIQYVTYTPEALRTVSNGLGITTTVTYDRINKPSLYTKDATATFPNVDINGPFFVVSQVDSSNGIGGTYSSTYKYVGLKADHTGRGLLGFRQRIITDLQTNVVETTTFRQDFPYLGLVASQTKVKGAVTLNTKTNTFASSSPGTGRYLVTLSQTVEASNDLNGAALPTVTTSYQYDAFANATQVSVSTTDGSTKVTNSTFSNDTTNWLLGRLLTANQTNTVGGVALTRQTSYAYNATSGLLTQEVVEPNIPALRLQTDYTYDSFGNKTVVTVSGADIVTRSSSVGYDTQGRFPTSATNALTQGTSQALDARHGGVTSTTDLNGLVASATYDAFGRAATATKPDGTKVSAAYAYCSGVNGGTASCVVGSAFVVTSTPLASDGVTQNGPQSKTYFDALTRPITQDTQGFDGSLIRVATQYDAFGRVAQVSRPYFVTGGTPKWTVNTYDGIGRVIDIARPNGGHTATTYNGLVTTVTNALTQTTSTTRNQLGQIASVTDNAGTTTYTYDQYDNVKTITDSAGNVTTYTYDGRGRKIAANDPDMGLWQYTSDVLGELITQTDAKNQTTTLTYDKLGRVTQRVEPGLTSTFVFDTAVKGVGKPASDSATNGTSHTFAYDSLSRPSSVMTTVDGSSYTVSTIYDAHGRPLVTTYPSGFAVKNIYTSLGYLSQVVNNATLSPFWTANTANAELQITQQTAGNTIITNRTFDANTGLVQTIQAGFGNAAANFGYTFDVMGTLTSRTDSLNSLTENFTYDNMNRLTQYAIVGGSTKTVSYDALGNITSKSDVGTYAYPAAGTGRPHAIGSISGTINTIYTYDANGNMIAGQGRTVTYTSFNMAASISQGSTTIGFTYDANHSRIKQTVPDGTTIYVAGGVERFTATSGLVQWNEYLSAGGQLIGVHFTRSNSTQNTRYFVTDHLGSVAVLTDESGVVVERLSYDAWGKRRFANGADDNLGTITSQTTRGFTGQEQIPSVGLVNLNARIYDPVIGRFMSADSQVDDIYLSQVLNRYAYVLNNPLSLTDPTGHSVLSKLFHKIPILRAILSIAVAIVFQQWQFLVSAVGELGAAVVGGMASGLVAGGTLKSTLIGGITAAAFYGVGSLKDELGIAGDSVGDRLASAGLHGAVGGLSSVAQGGKFESGFLAAGFADLSGPVHVDGVAGNAVIHAVTGGIGSVLGGGKFENGAITGAFGYLFNERLHPQEKVDPSSGLCPDTGCDYRLLHEIGDAFDPNAGMLGVGPGGGLGWAAPLVGEFAPIELGLSELLGSIGSRAAIGTTVFKTGHYAPRLQAVGLNVSETEGIVAREILMMRSSLVAEGTLSGRMTIQGIQVEYRAYVFPNGTVNVGTIFPVKP